MRSLFQEKTYWPIECFENLYSSILEARTENELDLALQEDKIK